MKSFLAATFVFLLFGSVSVLPPYGAGYSPVFMERDELERSVFYIPGERTPANPGKIYCRSPYIFVNERYKGIHVINNSDPANPVHEGFIVAPGCIDMAMKGDVLYLDNAVDLVAFDFATKQVTERIRNVMPEPVAPNKMYWHGDRGEKALILVGWESTNKSYLK
ncbi:MAG: hypothetical protein LBP64_04660 [Tannerella sp.]|jgi:hypothetical protein|nr:hypothetical protein [Tannerella sp.]